MRSAMHYFCESFANIKPMPATIAVIAVGISVNLKIMPAIAPRILKIPVTVVLGSFMLK